MKKRSSNFLLFILLAWFTGASAGPDSDTARVQRILNSLGFSAGVVDGYYGPATQQALQSYYVTKGQTYDGEIGRDDISALQSDFDAQTAELMRDWKNLPSGFLKSHQMVAPALIPYFNSTLARAYADVDGDGSVELFGVRQLWNWRGVTKAEILKKGSRASFFKLNSGTNTWKAYPDVVINNYENGCVHPRAAIAGDFNNDGRVDFFVACHGVDLPPYPREPNNIYLQQENGTFTISDPWADIGFYHSAASADFNQDGFLDVVVTNNMAGKGNAGKAVLRVYINDGTGKFEYTPKYVPEELRKWNGIFKVSTQDFNDDGLFDLFVGGHEFEGAKTTVYLNPGNNDFRRAAKIRIPKVREWELVLDVIYHQGRLFILRTGGGGTKTSRDTGYYQGAALQEFDLLSRKSTVVLKLERDDILSWPHWITKYEDEAGRVFVGADETRLGALKHQID